MRLILALLAAFTLAAAAPAGEPCVKTRLTLELELARTKAKQPIAATTTLTDYRAAHAEACRTGKPLFLTVGLDCSRLCSGLRPDMVTAHCPTFAGSSKPRAVLGLPDGKGGLWQCQEWTELPTDEQVRQAARHWRETLKPKASAIAAPLNWCGAT